MEFLKRNGRLLVDSLLSGLMLGLGGTVYIAVCAMGQPVIAAFLFAFGLLMILIFGFKLFTGAVCYTADQPLRKLAGYLWFLAVIWIGNFAGVWLFGSMIRLTRHRHLVEGAARLGANKIADPSLLSVFFLAVGCGILIYIAVDCFKRDLPGIIRLTVVFLSIAIFILCGFEHVVANMFYFCCGGHFSADGALALTTLKYLGVMTLGNGVGGALIPVLNRLR